MKVKDAMQFSVLTVTEETPIKEATRLIFSSRISSLPVLSGGRLTGILSEEDIIERMYPNIQERSFRSKKNLLSNKMGDKFVDLLEEPVGKIMNRIITTVSPEDPLQKAYEIMLKNNYSILPVVKDKNKLIGVIGQGDIFNQLIKADLPSLKKEKYSNFMASYYDEMIDWDQRLEQELPSFLRVFKREKVKKVLDIGVWTGTFSIGLAKKGFSVVGIEDDKIVLNTAQKRREKLPKSVKKNLVFKYSDYKNISKKIGTGFDASLCLGNSLLYLPGNLTEIFKEIHSSLRNNGTIILQVLNTERVLSKKRRLLNFQIKKDKEIRSENLFIEFFDEKNEKTLIHNLLSFSSERGEWVYKGETSLEIRRLYKEDIEKVLKEVGFKNISISGYQSDYQGEYWPISFVKPFDPKTSDWMIIVAKK